MDNMITKRIYRRWEQCLYWKEWKVNVDGSMFGFKQSIWNNPYSISEYGRKKCLKMYKQYIIQK